MKTEKRSRLYQRLGKLGAVLVVFGALLSLYYLKALFNQDLGLFLNVTGVVLPLFLFGSVCLACWNLNERVHELERRYEIYETSRDSSNGNTNL